LAAEVVQVCVPVPAGGGVVLGAVGVEVVGAAGVGVADVGVVAGEECVRWGLGVCVWCGLGLCVDDWAAGEDEDAVMPPPSGWQPVAAAMAAATATATRIVRGRECLVIGGPLSTRAPRRLTVR
jgi:hypothetical protein